MVVEMGEGDGQWRLVCVGCGCRANAVPPRRLSPYPTNSKLHCQHQSTRFKVACQQSATPSKQDHLHFRSLLLLNCASRSIALHVQYNALSSPDFPLLHITNTNPNSSHPPTADHNPGKATWIHQHHLPSGLLDQELLPGAVRLRARQRLQPSPSQSPLCQRPGRPGLPLLLPRRPNFLPQPHHLQGHRSSVRRAPTTMKRTARSRRLPNANNPRLGLQSELHAVQAGRRRLSTPNLRLPQRPLLFELHVADRPRTKRQ